MYCKSCGAENPSSANYCIKDGALLNSNSMKYRRRERNSTFCSSCGTKSSSLENYCPNCGASLSQYDPDKGFKQKFPGVNDGPVSVRSVKLPGFSLSYIKSAILPALLAILLVFLFSFSALKSTEKMYNNLLNDELQNSDMNSLINAIGSQTDLDLLKEGKLIGVSDIVMLSNLQNPDITFQAKSTNMTETASADISAKNGFLIYLLIPFVSLFAAGILSGRRNRRTNLSQRLYDAFGIAILYSLTFTIVSLFAGFSYHLNLSEDPFNMIVNISNHYSFIETLLMTLLFGFLFSILGILFSTGFRKTTGHLAEWIPSGEAIHQAISVPVRGILILFVIVCIYLSSKLSDMKALIEPDLAGTPFADLLDKSYSAIISVSLQLGSYIWNLLHLSSLSFTGGETGDVGSITYSILSGVKTTGSAKDANADWALTSFLSNNDLELYLKLALIIPIALLIWAGFQIAKQPNLIKNLIIFSCVYAVFMMGLAAFSDVGFSLTSIASGDHYAMSIVLGFSPFGTFISSLIISFIFAYVGSWIYKWRINR